jgi:hypothetical protein
MEFGGQQTNPAGLGQRVWLSGQTHATPFPVTTHFELPAQQIAGPPAAAWQMFPCSQQTGPVGVARQTEFGGQHRGAPVLVLPQTVPPLGHTQVPLGPATVPSGQQPTEAPAALKIVRAFGQQIGAGAVVTQ